MTDEPLRSLTLLAAIGAGLSAGVFFTFSTFVMKALSRLPSPEGIRAMQQINVAAPNPWFMVALFGTSAACLVLGVSALLRWDEPASAHQLVGSILFLAVIVLTVTYHVPRNDELAALAPDGAGAAKTWNTYVSAWTAWNHVRTVLSLAAASTLTLALRVA
jgi:uncharacterized membrane protein